MALRRRRWVVVAAGVLAALLVVGMAFVAGDAFVREEQLSPRSTPTPSPAAPKVPPGFVEFVDEKSGISIAHPATWQRVAIPDPQVRLVATPNQRDYVQLRVVPGGGLPPAAEQERRIRGADKSFKLLEQPRQITLGELSGYVFLYTFRDESGKDAYHSHYFLSDGLNTIILVFQALPAERQRLAELAPLFDQIANSLQVKQVRP